MKEVPLAGVVRAVERRRNWVAVRWGSLALGDLRQQAGEFDDVGFPGGKRCPLGVGQQGGYRPLLRRNLTVRDLTPNHAVLAVRQIESRLHENFQAAGVSGDR